LDPSIFEVGVIAKWYIFGYEVWFTETIRNAWIVIGALVLFSLIVRLKLRNYDSNAPTGLQNIVEMMVEAFDRFVRSCAGPRLAFLGNWYFAVFCFILVSNVSGMWGLFRPPTADWFMTFPLAFVTFCLINVMGAIYAGKAYWKGFLEPIFIFLPLNIIGELAKPISLSFRLFGNLLSGMILMTILYTIGPWFIQIGLPAALHAYFDLAMGVLQAYIFTVLSLSFIGAMAGTANEQA